MRLLRFAFLCMLTQLFFNCNNKEKDTEIIVNNTLNLDRSFETVSLSKALLKGFDLATVGIKEKGKNAVLTTQTVDTNGDGILDVLLFQPKIAANSEKTYSAMNP